MLIYLTILTITDLSLQCIKLQLARYATAGASPLCGNVSELMCQVCMGVVISHLLGAPAVVKLDVMLLQLNSTNCILLEVVLLQL